MIKKYVCKKMKHILMLSVVLLSVCVAADATEMKPVSVTISGVQAMVTASSELQSKTQGTYSVKNLFDGNDATAWVEGAKGNGVGEFVEIAFASEVSVFALVIKPGYCKNEKSFMENVVPLTINIKTDKKNLGNFSLNYETEYNASLSAFGVRYCTQSSSPLNYESERILFFSNAEKCKTVKVSIVSVPEGETRFSDLCVTELYPVIDAGFNNLTKNGLLIKNFKNSVLNTNNDLITSKVKISTFNSFPLEKDIYRLSTVPPISYAETVQKKCDKSNSVFYDTTTMSKPVTVPRLPEAEKNSQCDFFTVNRSGFVNTFITIFKNMTDTYFIGDWTLQYRIEADEMSTMARYPVIKYSNNSIVEAFEVPVCFDEGECSFMPSIKQVLNNKTRE